MLLFAALGIGVFGAAHGIGAMMLGRLLIGVGVSVCMSAAFKALAQILPVAQLPMVNGLVMAVGGLGGVVVGSPLAILLGVTDWRNICFGLVVMTLAVAAAIFLFAPEHRDGVHRKADMLTQFKGTWHILRSSVFWKIASFSVVTQGVFYAMQSLWIRPYLLDVMGLSAQYAAVLVSVLGIAMMIGCVGFGVAARGLQKRGVTVYAFCGFGMGLFVLVQVLMLVRAPITPALLIACYGVFGGTGILSYAVMAEYFPTHMIGRAHSTLTLVLFILIFGLQVGIGAMLSCWPAQGGHYPTAAHLSVWGVLIAMQIASAIWYVLPSSVLEKRGGVAS
jgi:predicted MFS family arabinose efflux permease